MKKGFTLIELLAVIVILAVIALIATPMILGVVEKVKKGAAEQGVNGYLDAIDKQKVINQMNSDDTDDINEYVYDLPFDSKYNIKVKGKTPSKGWVEVTKKGTGRYSVVIGDYVVTYDGTTKTVTKGTEPSSKPIAYSPVLYSRSHISNVIGHKILMNDTVYEVRGTIDGEERTEIVGTLEDCHNAIASAPEEALANLHQENGEYCFKTTINYESEYQPSLDSSWDIYLKYILSSDGVIEDAKTCCIFDGEEFCLDTSKNFDQITEALVNKFSRQRCAINDYDVGCDHKNISASTTNGVGGRITMSHYKTGNLSCSVYRSGFAKCEGEN